MNQPLSQKTSKTLHVLGWREWAKLPKLGISRIKIKVDTGAKTSSIHVSKFKIYYSNLKPMVRFSVHPLQRNSKLTVQCTAELIDQRWVKTSSGHSTWRPVIKTEIQFGSICFPIELTLADRDLMGYRMLLGREAIRNRFVVDPSHAYLFGKPPRKKRKTP